MTQPFRYMKLATEGQALVLNIESFPASQYMDKVPDPTADAIQKQYDQFKDTEPGDFSSTENTSDDPTASLGFGFRMPERRKVQFIGLESDDLHRAAVATKSALDWNIQAVDEFRSNRDDYDGAKFPFRSRSQFRFQPRSRPSNLANDAQHRADDTDVGEEAG